MTVQKVFTFFFFFFFAPLRLTRHHCTATIHSQSHSLTLSLQHLLHTTLDIMTTLEETTTPDIVATENTAEAGSSSNPFLTTDETHDRAINLVLDTSPFLRGGASKLRALADKFYTIPEVLNEIRDKQARKDLDMLPFDIQVINPNESSVRAG